MSSVSHILTDTTTSVTLPAKGHWKKCQNIKCGLGLMILKILGITHFIQWASYKER